MKTKLFIGKTQELPAKLTYLDALKLKYTTLSEWITIHIEPTWFCVSLYNRSLEFHGRKYFVKTRKVSEFCKTKTGRYYGTTEMFVRYASDFKEKIFKAINQEWAVNLPESFLGKKEVVSSILLGKYHSEEAIFEAYLKKHFPGCFDWTDVKEFYKNCGRVSLADLKDFTTNPKEALHRLVVEFPTSNQLFQKCCELAVLLDEKVDPSWSYDKTFKEHFRMKCLQCYDSLNEMKDTPFYTDKVVEAFKALPGVTLCNSERDLYSTDLKFSCYHHSDWKYGEIGKNFVFLLTKDEVEYCISIYYGSEGWVFTNIIGSKDRTPDQHDFAYLLEYFNQVDLYKLVKQDN